MDGRLAEPQPVVGECERGLEEAAGEASELGTASFGDQARPVAGDGIAAGAEGTGPVVLDVEPAVVPE